MVKKCVVCGSLFDKNAGVSFHRFPKERVTRRKWLRACNATETMIASSSMCVCSKHFKSVDFDQVYWPKKRLRPNVVPCVSDSLKSSYPTIKNKKISSLPPPSPRLRIPAASLKKEIKIIEVYSEAASNSKSAPAHNHVKREIDEDDDDDIQIIDEYIVGPDKTKQDIKITQVFSEAPHVLKPETNKTDSDSDIEIIEDSSEKVTSADTGSTLYKHNGSSIDNEEFVKFSDILKQTEYIRNLTVENFSTPKGVRRNLDFTKMTVANLTNKMKKFRVENHRLLTRIEHYKNVLLYLRNNNVILEKNDLMMVNKLL